MNVEHTASSPTPTAQDRRGGLSVETMTVWGLCLLVLLETFADLRRGPWGPPWLISSYLVVHGVVALICLPIAVRHRARLTRPVLWFLVAGLALCLWSLGSAMVCPTPTVAAIVVPRAYLVMPSLTALVTFVAAAAAATSLPRPGAADLWWPAALTVVAAFVQWPRSAGVHGSARLATGMGGSAVVHVALLVASAVLLRAAVAGCKVVLSAVLAGAGFVAIVLTGSRAGLGCLGLFLAGLALVRVTRSPRGRRSRPIQLLVAAGALAVVALLVTTIPVLRRVLTFGDPLRKHNMETALRVWSADPWSIVVGVGSGRLWPWYIFDAHLTREPWRGIIATQWGPALNSAHSTALQVLVELGLVGVVLALPLVVVPVWALVRSLRRAAGPRTIVLWAVVCTLPAFLLDSYLLKNYGVSMWWWLVAVAALIPAIDQRPPSTSRQKAG